MKREHSKQLPSLACQAINALQETEWRVLTAPLLVTLPDYESEVVKAAKAPSMHTILTADRKSPGTTFVSLIQIAEGR